MAELYRQRYGGAALLRLLSEAIPDDRIQPGPLHDALRSVPWRSVLTTNYDTLLERTFEPHRRVCVCVDDVDLVRSDSVGTLEILHLHGVLHRPETIVLAYEDYRKYPDRHNGFITKVRQLFLQHPVLFLGFGITDPNFLQWAGWLADLVGDQKNPWLNLTMDPMPDLSNARYWSARLDFVSIERSVFKTRMLSILELLSEALGKDTWSKDVAKRRIAESRNIADAIAEVENILAMGKDRGREGHGWRVFKSLLFNLATSRVLDLAKEPWRENPNPSRDPTSLELHIDFRPPAFRKPDEELNAVVVRAFGSYWDRWTRILRQHCTSWEFRRIDFREERGENARNATVFSLSGDGVASKAAPTSESVDPTLQSLWDGNDLVAPSRPRTAQEHRMAGYIWYQQCQMRRAADCYQQAAQRSRLEREPLRVERLTLVSQRVCLDQLLRSGNDDELQELRAQVHQDIEKIDDALALVPPEEGMRELASYEVSSLKTATDRLVEQLERTDLHRTTRLGSVFGDADQWLDYLERYWLAPALCAQPADVLGLLRWEGNERIPAAQVLARYGSKRLGILSRSAVRRPRGPNVERELIAELLKPGRWPGEWLARAEALQPLLPSCTDAELGKVADFAEQARYSLGELGEVYRGGLMMFAWVTFAQLDKLETSTWRWLSPDEAVVKVEKWIDCLAEADDHDLKLSEMLTTMVRLPWEDWVRTQKVSLTRIRNVFARSLAVRVATTERRRTDDIEQLLNATARIVATAGAAFISDSAFARAIQDSIDLVDKSERKVLSLQLKQTGLDYDEPPVSA
ncbi:MAG: SIR2 family protein [Polyangiaceae bacterium]